MDRLTFIFSALRAASKSHKRFAFVPATTVTYRLLDKLYKDGLIYGYNKHSSTLLRICLKYNQFGSGLLRNLKKVSIPSNRVYLSYSQLTRLYKQNSYVLVSTSFGLLSLKDIRYKNLRLGGELVGILKSF